MSLFAVGLIGFVFLLLFMLLGMPIAIAFAVTGVLGTFYVAGRESMLGILATVPYAWVSNQILLTMPLFMLMGHLSAGAGISRDLYDAAYKWLARLPGGLAVATIAASTGFAAVTGSSVASAATMTAIAMPEMKRHKYDVGLAAGAIAIGGTLAIMIPPSTLFILYAVLTEESIGKLFIAGIFPGLLLSAIYMVYVVIVAIRKPVMAPRGPAVSWKDRFLALRGVWATLFVFGLVMGGIWGGVFTPTEAAGVGALGCLLVAVVRRKASRKTVVDSLRETLKTSCMIFGILIGAFMFNAFLAVTHLPADLAKLISSLPVPGIVIVIAILLLYIPLGMFMDGAAMIVLTVPIFYPVVTALGFSNIWFAVLVCAMVEIGLLTPPVGINCFVIAGTADVSLTDVFKGAIPFALVAMFGVAILTAFPAIALWLPGTM